jgi:deazaflavin-dependent oxidoreductase (nitroreductase family)
MSDLMTSETKIQFQQPTAVERSFNRVFGAIVGLVGGPAHSYVLEVRGRKSGQLYTTPVYMFELEGKLWLVAPRGDTQWARNAVHAGEVVLKRGRSRTTYRTRLTGDEERPVVLRAYLERFRSTVQRYFSVQAGAPIEAFAAIASQHPVFELTPA